MPLTPMQKEITAMIMHQKQHARAEVVSLVPPTCPTRLDIPSRYRTASLTSPHHTQSISFVQEHLTLNAGCLILSGNPGCGKTYAAVAGLYASPFRSKRFAFFPTVCDKLLAFASREETRDTLCSVRFLVLDDFGAGAYPLAANGWSDATIAGMFDAILTHREANELPTIITTNLSGQQLSERLSDRLKSRLNGSWATLRTVTGPDLRSTKIVA